MSCYVAFLAYMFSKYVSFTWSRTTLVTISFFYNHVWKSKIKSAETYRLKVSSENLIARWFLIQISEFYKLLIRNIFNIVFHLKRMLNVYHLNDILT